MGGVKVKAPFPWFGGKSRAAELIWSRFGNVRNYVEPFAGSIAVMLARPHWPFDTDAAIRLETINDKDAYVANFWRALQSDPEGVCAAADAPVNEVDLHARHRWLLGQVDHVERLKCDPDYYDARIAGYWAWGLSSWIGGNFCQPRKLNAVPHLGGRVNRQLPHLGDNGNGVNRQLPRLGGKGRGVNGGCQDRYERLLAYFYELADRLRGVRVCCGDWTRVLTPSVTTVHGVTAVLLDPPYDVDGTDYGESSKGISSAVREWALLNGDDPRFKIAFCGYEDEGHSFPSSWECVAWKAGGGYNNLGDGKNRHRERIWFSPACSRQVAEGELFT